MRVSFDLPLTIWMYLHLVFMFTVTLEHSNIHLKRHQVIHSPTDFPQPLTCANWSCSNSISIVYMHVLTDVEHCN
jgi:hypothetical protein